MRTTLIRAAGAAVILALTALGSAQASPVRPLGEVGGTTATQVQYYGGGYPNHHAYRPPHHAYRPPHHQYRHHYKPQYRHHGGYHRY